LSIATSPDAAQSLFHAAALDHDEISLVDIDALHDAQVALAIVHVAPR
jgi:hypothetical protein